MCKEHRDMCYNNTASGVEHLELYERQTKTRTRADYSDLRAVPTKMFATDESERDHAVYW